MREATEEELSRADKLNETLEKLTAIMEEAKKTPQKVNIVADNSGEQNTPTRPSNSEWWRKKTLNEQINQAISGDGTGMR